ncbi:MAG: hypothetical protein U0441_35330 [Polyangiaceae bacterium]
MRGLLCAVAMGAVLLACPAAARAEGKGTVSTEVGAGTARWDGASPADVYSYERLGISWDPWRRLTFSGLGMVLRERLAGTRYADATTWMFGGGAEIRPTEALTFSATAAFAPEGPAPGGARRSLATGMFSASYEGLTTGPFETEIVATCGVGHLALSAPGGVSATVDQWSIGGTVTETLDDFTDVSLTVTGYLYGGDTSIFRSAGGRVGSRMSGMAPYQVSVRPEITRSGDSYVATGYWQVASLIDGAGHETLAGAEVHYLATRAFSPMIGVEGSLRTTESGTAPSALVLVGARLRLN